MESLSEFVFCHKSMVFNCFLICDKSTTPPCHITAERGVVVVFNLLLLPLGEFLLQLFGCVEHSSWLAAYSFANNANNASCFQLLQNATGSIETKFKISLQSTCLRLDGLYNILRHLNKERIDL